MPALAPFGQEQEKPAKQKVDQSVSPGFFVSDTLTIDLTLSIGEVRVTSLDRTRPSCMMISASRALNGAEISAREYPIGMNLSPTSQRVFFPAEGPLPTTSSLFVSSRPEAFYLLQSSWKPQFDCQLRVSARRLWLTNCLTIGRSFVKDPASPPGSQRPNHQQAGLLDVSRRDYVFLSI